MADDDLMDPARAPREMGDREHEMRPKAEWRPPSLLPVPELHDGYHYRWIRIESHGREDQRNVSMKRREGYEPVMSGEQPELAHLNDDPRREGVIINGGLMLCKMPKEFVAQRNRYYQNLHRNQIDAVDNQLLATNTDRRAPLLKPQRRTVVGFGD